ncbi:BgTH12-04359 [Blumeria graminis f. sp. triticale]|uniref:BgTH12-04359 n=1 Tax=Blumeria graminis f. sp. triticale TaxID=1689686 RepID=A0A9W4GBX7_BLUGR|nr:BgTH12-04359 [Blumeria graminis f. sp. triticale]
MNESKLCQEKVQSLLQDAERRLRLNQEVDGSHKSSNLTEKIPHMKCTKSVQPYIKNVSQGPRFDSSQLVPAQMRKSANGITVVTDPIQTHAKEKDVKETAGPDWFNLPRTKLTPELKRDLQLIQMRDVLDPKRHYKKDKNRGKIPEYSQVGTVIQGPTEYLSSRLTNRERKRTLLEEILNSEKKTGRFKKKYTEIQNAKTSGKKSHYKKLKESRTKSRISKR